MISKAEIQFVISLQQKKIRQREQLFIAEGTKISGELLRSDYSIDVIYALKNWLDINETAIGNLNCKEVDETELKKISSLATPNEVLCVVKMKQHDLELSNLKNKLTLALDEIQDPGNLGTIIRIADWFGVETILCSEKTVDIYNAKVIQASMGSFLRTHIFYGDLKVAIEFAKENAIPIYAAVLGGKSIYEETQKNNGILLLGNESKGISEEIKNLVANQISIPSFSKEKVDSLNVSIAAAILCSEFKRNL